MAGSIDRLKLTNPRDVLGAIASAADAASMGVAISAIDTDPPEMLYISESAARILGYAPEELLEKSVWECIAPEELPRLTAMLDRRRRDDELRNVYETTALRKDGSRVFIEVVSIRSSVDGRLASVTFIFDVSERRRAESALKSSEGRFRSVVEGSPDGIAILRDGEILYLNPAAASMLGYDGPDEGVGARLDDLLEADDAAKAHERMAILLRTGKPPPGTAEYHSRRKDGEPVIVEISSILIDYEGAPAVLAFARDVTERKAIEARLVQADRLAAVGTLAAGVAHEINNPLAYLLLNLQYVERELERMGGGSEQFEQLIRRVQEAAHGAERVSTIVRDLKAFARQGDGERTPISLQEVMEHSIRIAENEIRHRARLTRDYREVSPVLANAARLEQVFLNLLVNAAQALPEGDPTVDEIRVVVRQEHETVIAEITDTGSGIDPADRDRIFDPFFTTKPIGVGTGLGLPICQGIVEGLGGRIDMDSIAGFGTTVRVVLPAYAAEADEDSWQPTTRSEVVPVAPRQRLLVIDDEPFVGRIIENLLHAENDIRVATSAQEGLELLAAGLRFDAILCDLLMPAMSGMDFYEAVSRDHSGLEKRIVFMTGGAFVPRVSAFLDRIDNLCIEKPFDIDELRRALSQLGVQGPSPRSKTSGGL